MNFITGKSLDRRTFLRGMGASVAIPYLDAMTPAGRMASRALQNNDATRLVAIELVHGAAGCNEWGASQNLWSPADTGKSFDLTPTSLSPLENYRDYLTIISNTDVRMAEAFTAEEIGGDHFRSSAVFLTQSHPKQTEGSDVFVGTSLDQLYAQRFGKSSPIPSSQLCIENIDQAGGCAYGYTCVYTDSISWASPTEPLPVIRDPRVAFEQLFGAGTTVEDRMTRMMTKKSILDWILKDYAKLNSLLGANDREKLDSYFNNIREIERRIQLTEERNASGDPRDIPEAPLGVPDSFVEHMQMMFDVQALAFESDVTRVFSLKTGRDSSARVYPESGTDTPFHPASHHGGREQAILDFATINKFHVGMLPYFLDKLKNIEENGMNMLDKSLIIFGSPMADGNLHNHRRCPLIFLGGANGRLEGNIHIKTPDGTPMANAMLSAMHALGMDDMESFGDSTGALQLNQLT